MAAQTNTLIRIATRDNLAEIYALARTALHLDTFTAELLDEKLFAGWCCPDTESRVHVAEIGGHTIGFLQSVLRPAAAKAWLGLFAVSAEHRRRGVAATLYQTAFLDVPREISEIEVLAIPGNYFAPGLDPRYTEAHCLVERLGFERFNDCVNLTAPLDSRFETADEETRLAAAGIEVRRAAPKDRDLLDRFFDEQFGADWRYEAELALDNNPPALHLALRDGQVIAFSAHSTQNREWGFFGPMGTTPAARGHGIGRVLLWHCLNDLRDAGHRTGVIPWVGPIAFYQQWANCRVDRVFWRYRRTIEPQS